MRNFNLRYECNDACDNYSANVKKDKQNIFTGSWATEESLKDLDVSADQYEDQPDLEAAYEEALLSIDPKSSYFRKLETMNKIERIIRGLGWLDKLTGHTPVIDKTFEPKEKQSGSQWAALVQLAKKKILALRARDISSSSSTSKQNEDTANNHVDEVVISDMSYIDKHFRAKQEDGQKLIDDTTKEYSLNEEQERAFCIVANHATLHRAEQLKMYLGGMGGTGKPQVIKALISFNKAAAEPVRANIII